MIGTMSSIELTNSKPFKPITLKFKSITLDTPRLIMVPISSISPALVSSFLCQLFNDSSISLSPFLSSLAMKVDIDFVIDREWSHSNALNLLSIWNESQTDVWILFPLRLLSVSLDTYPPRQSLKTHSQSTIQASNPIKPPSEGKFPIGLVSLSPTSHDTLILDCLIRRDYEGKGFATEASKAILNHLFTPNTALRDSTLQSLFEPALSVYPKPQVQCVAAMVKEGDGKGWARVLEKLGMKGEGATEVDGKLAEIKAITKDIYLELWA